MLQQSNWISIVISFQAFVITNKIIEIPITIHLDSIGCAPNVNESWASLVRKLKKGKESFAILFIDLYYCIWCLTFFYVLFSLSYIIVLLLGLLLGIRLSLYIFLCVFFSLSWAKGNSPGRAYDSKWRSVSLGKTILNNIYLFTPAIVSLMRVVAMTVPFIANSLSLEISFLRDNPFFEAAATSLAIEKAISIVKKVVLSNKARKKYG